MAAGPRCGSFRRNSEHQIFLGSFRRRDCLLLDPKVAEDQEVARIRLKGSGNARRAQYGGYTSKQSKPVARGLEIGYLG